MRKILFAINTTADGFCGHTDMIPDDELHSYFTRILRGSDLILYGRVTYQLMVPFWPEVARTQSMSEAVNEFARVFDSLDKILFSATLRQVEDPKTKLLHTNLKDEVIALREKPGKEILVGSLSLASQLSQHRLIDEYRFVVHPVIAGKGPRLFDTVSLEEKFQLEFQGSETLSSGVIALRYKKPA